MIYSYIPSRLPARIYSRKLADTEGLLAYYRDERKMDIDPHKDGSVLVLHKLKLLIENPYFNPDQRITAMVAQDLELIINANAFDNLIYQLDNAVYFSRGPMFKLRIGNELSYLSSDIVQDMQDYDWDSHIPEVTAMLYQRAMMMSRCGDRFVNVPQADPTDIIH